MDLLDDSVIPEYAREVKHEARVFADEHIAPVAADYYESGEFPWPVVEAGQDAGLVGQDIGEEYGGRGLDVVQMLAIAEEFFRADAGIALSLQLASFGAEIVEKYGTEEQKQTYIRPVAKGEVITGLAVSEPQTGSDMAGMQTRADRDGDEYVLNGEKFWIGHGVEAEWVTLFARTGDGRESSGSRATENASRSGDGEANRYGNHSLFIVPTDTGGYHAEHIPEKIAMRASKQAHITLEDCRIPVDNRISHEGTGFMMLAEFFNSGRAVVAGHGLGLAAAAIEETIEFVGDREGFGRTLDSFQAVQHGVADMLLEFESARALSYNAAERVRDGVNPGYWAALSKLKATEAAVTCSQQGMQFHGGRSILRGRRINRVFRDARIPVIYEGASEVQRNLIFSQRP